MDTKKLISPLVLIGLMAAFGIVCLMVGFTKGKSALWIKQKMKIGAAIITLTSVSTGCPPVVTCYDPVMPNIFEFDQLNNQSYQIIADLPNDSVLTGTIYQREAENFDFEVLTNDSTIIQTGKITATDGVFDAKEEKFKIVLDTKIDTGLFQLTIYQLFSDSPTDRYAIFSYPLKIK